MDNMRRMSFQTSSLAHSRKRLCTVFQGPNSGCKSRHGAPVFIIHRIALNVRRSSLRLRPLVSVPAFANIGPIMAHFSSEMSCLLMEKQKQRTDEKSRFYLETAPRLSLSGCLVFVLRNLPGGRGLADPQRLLERWNGGTWRGKARNAFRLAAGCRLEGETVIRMKPVSDKALRHKTGPPGEDKPGGPVLPLSAGNGGRKG